jgi:hypothetical protein
MFLLFLGSLETVVKLSLNDMSIKTNVTISADHGKIFFLVYII